MSTDHDKPVFLMTDFGLSDPYVGLVKANILKRAPTASIVDLTHDVTPQDEVEASFLFEYCLPDIPEEGIITIIVDPEVGTDREILAAELTTNQTVVVPDTGIVDDSFIDKSYHVRNKDLARRPISSTFHGRDWFGPVTGFLSSNGGELESVGPEASPVEIEKGVSTPEFTENELIGKVIYVDHYGNMITNITSDDFNKFIERCGNREPTVVVDDEIIQGINETYDSDSDDLIALFGSFDRLEIASPGGSAYEILNEDRDKDILIRT